MKSCGGYVRWTIIWVLENGKCVDRVSCQVSLVTARGDRIKPLLLWDHWVVQKTRVRNGSACAATNCSKYIFLRNNTLILKKHKVRPGNGSLSCFSKCKSWGRISERRKGGKEKRREGGMPERLFLSFFFSFVRYHMLSIVVRHSLFSLFPFPPHISEL